MSRAARVSRKRLVVVVSPLEKAYRVGFVDPQVKNNEVMNSVKEKLKSRYLVDKALDMGFEK